MNDAKIIAVTQRIQKLWRGRTDGRRMLDCLQKDDQRLYKIELPTWGHTDYAYLVNNTNGWVSDDERSFVFDGWFDYQMMLSYFRNEKWISG